MKSIRDHVEPEDKRKLSELGPKFQTERIVLVEKDIRIQGVHFGPFKKK